jgi:hypothetical protein
MFYTKILPLLLLLTLGGCTPKIEQLFLTETLLERVPLDASQPNKYSDYSCNDALNYAPDTLHLDHTPMKEIRVNVHFMNSVDSSQNLYGDAAVEYAQQLLYYAGLPLEQNSKMFLPVGNTNPALPLRYRYVLYPQPDIEGDKGIYWHFDDDLYYFVRVGGNRNLGDKKVLNKYNVGSDTILNIFILPHHPDSVLSKTYQVDGTGIALGNNIKIAGLTESDAPTWAFKGLINHEIGHVLGLSHTWQYNDGCEDTPFNPNCWNYTDTPPCNTQAGNNVMDYNSRQDAWSPCQIGRIHRHLSDELNRARRTVVPNWCELHEDRTIVVTDSVAWKGEKDLEGHLTIADGGMLAINCRVSLPKGARITVKAGGTLLINQARLHNACGDSWEGITVEKVGKKRGRVVIIGDVKFENMAKALAAE